MSSHLTMRNIQQQDVMMELKNFVASAKQASKSNQSEIVKTALSLLRTLPSSRDAVLEYFFTIFNNATQNFVVRLETEIATGKLPPASEEDEIILSEIHIVIGSFIATNAEAWSPIISSWSLELLGELSTKYAGRAHVSTGVNESLQLWMSCRATRILIDVTTQCLSSLINIDAEGCISALLDTSVKHSPNFDWVVAHVGSCFPTTVITRVLSCGLKDFCQNKSYEQCCDSPKLKSVVGILGHLAGSHCDDIAASLIDLFMWSIRISGLPDADDIRLQRKATVPYLLQLAYLSPTLLLAITKNIKSILPLNVVVQLYSSIDDWIKYFGSPEALQDFIGNLILKCEVGATQIINILLECIFIDKIQENEAAKLAVKKCAREILEFVLQEIDVLVRTQIQTSNTEIKILDSLLREAADIPELLLSSERMKSSTASKLLIFLGHNNPAVIIKSCVFLFTHASTNEHLGILIHILTNELLNKTHLPYEQKGGHFSVVLEQVLSKPLEELNFTQIWQNLLTILQWEKSDRIPLLQSRLVSRAIKTNLVSITKLFQNEGLKSDVLHVMAELLDTLEITALEQQSANVPVQAVLNYSTAIVNYFFVCCLEPDFEKKVCGYKRIYGELRQLSRYSKSAKMFALRELLQRALFTDDKRLFGAQFEATMNQNNSNQLLLEQNWKKNKTIPITKNSSLLNGGVIGFGIKKSAEYNNLAKDLIACNVEHFIRAIKACCTDENKNNVISLDSLTTVSLLLVQFVSPDVMYNGLPWPEDEFSKVTIERDFYIRRLFNNIPLLWDLLALVAVYRPTLCYCSVLLRALTATLLHQWNSTGDLCKISDPEKYQSLVDTTVKVIDVMTLGQLLPPPLSCIRDIVSSLKCSEVVQIFRDCVWNYMRDHVPSPALFNCDSAGNYWRDPNLTRPPDIYITTLRIIMQQNIKIFGHLFAQMFINVPHLD